MSSSALHIAAKAIESRDLMKLVYGDRYGAVVGKWRDAINAARRSSGVALAPQVLEMAKVLKERSPGSMSLLMAAFADEAEEVART